MSPNEVSPQNQETVYQRLDIGTHSRTVSAKYTDEALVTGDIVRISKTRGAFECEFTPNWTSELFRVVGIDKYQKPTAYLIADMSGEDIEGVSYLQELQKVTEPETYAVERVLRTRGKGSNTQDLVKWLGYLESLTVGLTKMT